MQLIVINWIDADGSDCTTRFEREYDAIRFAESLEAAGLWHDYK
jgi:hypothetical protein